MKKYFFLFDFFQREAGEAGGVMSKSKLFVALFLVMFGHFLGRGEGGARF